MSVIFKHKAKMGGIVRGKMSYQKREGEMSRGWEMSYTRYSIG